MNVKFCNSNAFKIDSDELQEKVMGVCDTLFGFKLKRGRFPGPQPVTIEKKDFELLHKHEYMVCEKSDGERAILLLININNKPMCFIINRNNEFYFLDLSFKKEVFEGTIMDGELIQTKKGAWNYLIHDCMIYNGSDFTQRSHKVRYACIIDFIVKRYQNKEKDPVNLKTKLFYRVGPGLDKTWKCIQSNTENNIDGLIFTPVNKPITFGRDNFLLKWKEEHTIDLKVTFKNKKMILSYIKNDNYIPLKTYSPSNANYKETLLFLKNEMNTVIIEFKVVSEDSFIPYRIRTDKSVPNGEITVKNTFKNVQESIKIVDIVTELNYLCQAAETNTPATLLDRLSLAADSSNRGLAAADSSTTLTANSSSALSVAATGSDGGSTLSAATLTADSSTTLTADGGSALSVATTTK